MCERLYAVAPCRNLVLQPKVAIVKRTSGKGTSRQMHGVRVWWENIFRRNLGLIQCGIFSTPHTVGDGNGDEDPV